MAKGAVSKKAQGYHHGDLKAAIRTEAERILVERGVAEVGLREIARALGVSHNAPYRHYVNREALLAEIAADGFRRLGEQYAAVSPTDPAERIMAIGHMYLTFALSQPAVFRLMLGPELAKPEQAELKAAADRVFALVRAEVLAMGVPEPGIAEALGLWSLVHGLSTLLLDNRIEEHGGQIDPYAVLTNAAETFLAGLKAKTARSSAA